MKHIKILVRDAFAWMTIYAFVLVSCGGLDSKRDILGVEVKAAHAALVLPEPLAPPLPPALLSLEEGAELEDFPLDLVVSSTGEALWSYNIAMLPGRNNMSPTVTVNYRSKGGDSTIGRGFGLSGFSTISRCWPVRAQGTANQTEALTFGVSRAFCLDGVRLVARSDGANRYSPERDPSTLVIADGDSSNPNYFRVFTADGRISSFGARSSDSKSRKDGHLSRITPSYVGGNSELGFSSDVVAEAVGDWIINDWFVDVVEDRYGNQMTYNYSEERDAAGNVVEIVPTEINWTGNPSLGLLPQRKAQFFYATTPKRAARSGYRMGLPFKQSKLLKSIDVSGPAGLTSAPGATLMMWSFQFDYEAQPAGSQPLDLLHSIRRCFVSGRCAAPIQFDWSGIGTPTVPSFTPQPGAEPTPENTALRSGEDYAFSWSGYSTPDPGLGLESTYDLSVGDFNDDGFDDVLYRVPIMYQTDIGNWYPTYNSEGQIITQWRLRRGGLTGLQSFELVNGLPVIAGGYSKYTPKVVDIDGDGDVELLLWVDQGVTSSGDWFGFIAYAFQSPVGGPPSFEAQAFEPSDVDAGWWMVAGDIRRGSPASIVDVDGDGELDLLREQTPPNEQGTSSDSNRRNSTGLKVRSPAFGVNSTVQVHPTLGGAATPLKVFNYGARFPIDLDGDGDVEIVTDVDKDLCSQSRRGNSVEDRFSALTNSLLSFGVRTASGTYDIDATPVPNGPLEQSQVAAATFGSCSTIDQSAAAWNPPACFSVIDYNTRTPLSRLVGDFNGDGLKEVLSFPAQYEAQCGCTTGACSTQDYSSSIFLNVNRGSSLSATIPMANPWTASGTRLALASLVRTASPAPSPCHGACRPTSYSIDNGLRVLDLDGDGREEIIQVASQGQAERGQMMRMFRLSGGAWTETALNVPLAQAAVVSLGNEDTRDPLLGDGSGPRMTQFGDFNGDGLLDLVTMNTYVYAVLQVAHEPIVVRSVKTAHNAGAVLDYEYARAVATPESSLVPRGTIEVPDTGVSISVAQHLGLYNVSAACSGTHRCMRSLGWVVAREHKSPGFIVEHSYADGKIDRNGRGFIGVEEHISSDGMTTRRDVYDLTTREWPSGVDGYIYRQARIPRYSIVDAAFRTIEFNTETEGVSVRVVGQWEFGANHVFRSTRTVSQRDSFSNTYYTESMVANSLIPENPLATPASGWEREYSTRSATGSNAANCVFSGGACGQGWLLGRYDRMERTKDEPLQNGTILSEVVRWNYSFSNGTADVESSERRVMGGATDPDSVYVVQTTYDRDSFGNIWRRTRDGSDGTGGALSAVTQVAFQEYDTEKIFPSIEYNAEGHRAVTHRYASSGEIVAADDTNSLRTKYIYDEAMRLKEMSPAVGNPTTYSYGTVPGGGTIRTQAMGASSVTSYFGADRRPAKQIRVGATSSEKIVLYDNYGRVERVSLPYIPGQSGSAKFWRYELDNSGRVTHVYRPGEGAAEFVATTAYDGLKVTTTSERGIVSETASDVAGRPLMVTIRAALPTEDDVVTSYQYQLGSVTVTHPMSQSGSNAVTTISADPLGRVRRVSDPDTGISMTYYDAFDRPYRTQDANGGVTTTLYDLIDRPVLVETPATAAYPGVGGGGYARRSAFVYDGSQFGIGKLTSFRSMANPAGGVFAGGGETTIQYDSFGRPSWKRVDVSGGGVGLFQYQYDDALNVLSRLSYPEFVRSSGAVSAVEARYEHFSDGSVASVFAVVDGVEQRVWRADGLNALGAVEEETFGSGIKSYHRYDDSYALRYVQVGGAAQPFVKTSYRWGADGLLERRSDLDGAANSLELYRHDNAGRLVNWTIHQNCSEQIWSYRYDPAGNIVHREFSDSSGFLHENTDYFYDPTHPHELNRIEVNGATSQLKYDDAGNVKSGLGNDYDWAPFGLPQSISGPNGSVSLYSYNALGQRVAEWKQSGTRILTLDDLYVDRLGTQGHTASFLIPGREGVVAQLELSEATGAGFSQSLEFVHTDRQGNPDAVTSLDSGSATLVRRSRFAPFGERRSPSALAFRTSSSLQDPYAFTGHQGEDEFGLINMRGRIYDPRTSHFLSADPIVHPVSQGLNRYSYVLNSPVMMADPSGFDGVTDVDFSDSPDVIVGGRRRTPLAPAGGNDSTASVQEAAWGDGVDSGNSSPVEDFFYEIANDFTHIRAPADVANLSDKILNSTGVALFDEHLWQPSGRPSLRLLGGLLTDPLRFGEGLGAAWINVNALWTFHDRMGPLEILTRLLDIRSSLENDAGRAATIAGGVGALRSGLRSVFAQLRLRGGGILGPKFFPHPNGGGGTTWLSEGSINQTDFGGLVNSAIYEGKSVTIITGAHGDELGALRADRSMFLDDVEKFGDAPGVRILDINDLTSAQKVELVNGPGVVIGGFCFSAACLAGYLR